MSRSPAATVKMTAIIVAATIARSPSTSLGGRWKAGVVVRWTAGMALMVVPLRLSRLASV